MSALATQIELSPPLFPDLLDEHGGYGTTEDLTDGRRFRIWPIGPSAHRRDKKPVDTMRCLVVMWTDPSSYVQPTLPWEVEIRHYFYHWGPPRPKGRNLTQKYHTWSRRLETRAQAVALASRIHQAILRVVAAQHDGEEDQ